MRLELILCTTAIALQCEGCPATYFYINKEGIIGHESLPLHYFPRTNEDNRYFTISANTLEAAIRQSHTLVGKYRHLFLSQ